MKKIALCLLTLSIIMSCKEEEKQQAVKRDIVVDYPDTKKADTVTNYFGTDVKDP